MRADVIFLDLCVAWLQSNCTTTTSHTGCHKRKPIVIKDCVNVQCQLTPNGAYAAPLQPFVFKP